MTRRLTFHLVGGNQLSSTVEHEDAETIIAAWQYAQRHDDVVQTGEVSGVPVFHIAFRQVAAITDEIA